MSKAEERAMEVYPPRMAYNSMVSVALKEKRDINANNRQKFIQGYVTAEKDLTDKAKFSSGWDGFYYGQGYKQAEKDLGWHSIEESLPPYNEEVIALTDMMHGKQLSSAGCICYAHRPNPKGYNGRNIITGKVSHYEPMTYNGWNIEGVKYWMPCPKILE